MKRWCKAVSSAMTGLAAHVVATGRRDPGGGKQRDRGSLRMAVFLLPWLPVMTAPTIAGSPAVGGALAIVPFEHSAFPYAGDIPEQGKAFLDVTRDGRRGHTSPRGGVLWEDQAYSDRRSLLFIPKAFDPSKPAALVLFFHGNLATLDRDVVARQGVARQLAASRLNAVLVAPQMAFDALDSTAGHFYQPAFLDAYLDEAAARLETLSHGRLHNDDLRDLPVIIVAYSGGYVPTAFTLAQARTHRRVIGVILLDALFGEGAKFESWIVGARRDAFFLSAYSKASAPENTALRSRLETAGIPLETRLSASLVPGAVTFVAAEAAIHNDFMTRAWTGDPLAAALRWVVLR